MTLSLLFWLGTIVLALLGIGILNWRTVRRLRRASHAEEMHLAERWRVLTSYARLRDGRVYHPKRYPESAYAPERGRRS